MKLRWIYWLAIFLGAFLLFQIQPMIARMILPWFGGAAAVWITCMLFFQTALLLGYLYAHGLVLRAGPAVRSRVHLILLGASLFLLPVVPAAYWKPVGSEEPITRILLILAATAGLPYLLLASTSPLLQAEYARRFREDFPYRLFALSNLASLAGLLTYPTLVEPRLTTRAQALLWSSLYALYAMTCGAALLTRQRGEGKKEMEAVPNQEAPDWRTQALWIALPACASALLLAATQYLTENIAAVPLLWVVPLSAYLLSFILCFDRRSWYRPSIFLRLTILALLSMGWFVDRQNLRFAAPLEIGVLILGVFIVSMYCHGELVRRRPDPSHLTRFYLLMSAGGAMGGLLVGLLSPWLLPLPLDLPLVLLFTAILTVVVERGNTRLVVFVNAATVLAMGVIGVRFAQGLSTDNVALSRSFYGTLRVTREIIGLPAAKARSLEHGVIRHGTQLVEEKLTRTPTTYFAVGSGVERAIEKMRRPGERAGIIGLGVGTLAAYGAPGDTYRFYEINPQVVDLAVRRFSFLADSPARVEVVLGDGRLSLEREAPQNYDVFVVDAFSGDSIPAHLLTRESLRQYLRHLRPGGLIAIHISNKVLDLEPVIAALATDSGLAGCLSISADDPRLYRTGSTWALLSTDPKAVEGLGRPLRGDARVGVWTDDFYNVWSIIRWK